MFPQEPILTGTTRFSVLATKIVIIQFLPPNLVLDKPCNFWLSDFSKSVKWTGLAILQTLLLGISLSLLIRSSDRNERSCVWQWWPHRREGEGCTGRGLWSELKLFSAVYSPGCTRTQGIFPVSASSAGIYKRVPPCLTQGSFLRECIL